MDSKLGLQASKAKISNATAISDPLELRTLSSETPQIENNHKCSEASQNSCPLMAKPMERGTQGKEQTIMRTHSANGRFPFPYLLVPFIESTIWVGILLIDYFPYGRG